MLNAAMDAAHMKSSCQRTGTAPRRYSDSTTPIGRPLRQLNSAINSSDVIGLENIG